MERTSKDFEKNEFYSNELYSHLKIRAFVQYRWGPNLGEPSRISANLPITRNNPATRVECAGGFAKQKLFLGTISRFPGTTVPASHDPHRRSREVHFGNRAREIKIGRSG